MSQITVEEFDKLVLSLFEKRKEYEEKKRISAEAGEEVDRLQGQVVMALKELGRSSYKSDAGTVSITERWRVNLPSNEEDKKAFFNYLKEKGLLWQYATVNSNSLNSLFLTEWEIAKEEGRGMEFKVPGIGEPKLFESLSMRKG